MNKKLQATVLVVEDETAIAELLRYTLSSAGFNVVLSPTLNHARMTLNHVLPDAVIIDWMLPDGSGLAWVKELRAHKRSADLPLLMLTARALEEDKIAGLDGGADDYLTKPFSPRELVSRLRALLRRKSPQTTTAALQCGSIVLDATQHTVQVNQVALELAATEFKLLRFLMANQGRVFSRAQLLDKVWGDHIYLDERTIDVHVMRLRKALGDAGELLRTVRGAGYQLTAS